MPASKRKAFSQPMPQAYSDMMGIELVLHASLLHSMRESNGTAETNVAANHVTFQMEAQDRAEKLVADNFNEVNTTGSVRSNNGLQTSENSALNSNEIDPEFIGALEKARTFFVGAVNNCDSMSTEKDDRDAPYHEVKRIKRELEIEESNKSPSSDGRTDQEDHSAESTSYNQSSSLFSNELSRGILGLKKVPLAPAQEC